MLPADRIDGTIHVSASELVLSAGAVLRRVNLTTNTDPIVRLGYQGRLSGWGTLTTMNPSPRGVVNIGPHNLTLYENVEYAQVSGVHIQGAGLSWSIMKPANQTSTPQMWMILNRYQYMPVVIPVVPGALEGSRELSRLQSQTEIEVLLVHRPLQE